MHPAYTPCTHATKALIGACTFQWIETTVEQMSVDAQIMIPANVPGLNKVSCGLLTYCIDAAGEVAECALPWPRYGGDYDSVSTLVKKEEKKNTTPPVLNSINDPLMGWHRHPPPVTSFNPSASIP